MPGLPHHWRDLFNGTKNEGKGTWLYQAAQPVLGAAAFTGHRVRSDKFVDRVAHRDTDAPGSSAFFGPAAPGDMHSWHFLSAMGLVSIAVAYLVHLFLFREKRLHINRGATRYHRSVFWLGRLMVLTSLISGGMLYFDIFAMAALVDVHYLAALAWLLYLLIHGGVYFVQYGLLSLKRIVVSERVDVRKDGLILVTALVLFAIAFGWIQKSATHDLLVKQISIDESVRIDGIADEAAWEQAEALTINTIGGVNFVNGQTRVTIKALHNGTGAFFLIRWDDPSKSLQHLPLVKTGAGWKVSESGFYNFDETEYYEDKFALITSKNCGVGAAETTHLGPRPLQGKPPNCMARLPLRNGWGSARSVALENSTEPRHVLADNNLIGTPYVVLKDRVVTRRATWLIPSCRAHTG